jgi:hypothetical protein
MQKKAYIYFNFYVENFTELFSDMVDVFIPEHWFALLMQRV